MISIDQSEESIYLGEEEGQPGEADQQRGGEVEGEQEGGEGPGQQDLNTVHRVVP